MFPPSSPEIGSDVVGKCPRLRVGLHEGFAVPSGRFRIGEAFISKLSKGDDGFQRYGVALQTGASWEQGSQNPPWEVIMALVHHHQPDRGHDLALVGLVLVVFGIIAVAVPLARFIIDQLFSLV
jgi:hypothetical protein